MIEVEQPEGVIVQFGGQTPLRLAHGLDKAGVPLLGTPVESIDLAEDRSRFGGLMRELELKSPPYATATSPGEALERADDVGYPLLVRPSYVLGGRAMQICYSHDRLADYLKRTRAHAGAEIYLDRFLENAIEIDVDALCDGESVQIGAIMQHVEEAGVHSGDSACVIPAMSLGPEMLDQVQEATERLALRLGVVGLINIQFAVTGDEELYVIEANPRASRTVPFVSKAVGVPLAKVACRLMLGERLADMDLPLSRLGAGNLKHVSVKEAVLPFDRFPRADALLGPEMKSTGEVMGVAYDFPAAFGKAQAAAGAALPDEGGVFISVTDTDKPARDAARGVAPRPRLPHLRDRRHRARHPRHGRAGRADQEDRRGLAQRRGPHRVRRRGPRDQHPDRHRRALGRVGDPARGGRAGDPLHHDRHRRQRGPASDPGST